MMFWDRIAKAYIAGYLKGKGAEKIKSLMENAIPLWQAEEDKSGVDGMLGKVKQALLAIDDNEAIEFVYSTIRERCPELHFVTKEYVTLSLLDFRAYLEAQPRKQEGSKPVIKRVISAAKLGDDR